ncbi:MAG: hypothetical protein IKA23_03105 [Akkermansia sp.]|nr:hypothetical protein [Akkermansia sp.]
MADYSSPRVTLIRTLIFAMLGIVLLGYGFYKDSDLLWIGVGLFDLIYAAIISYPLWSRKK